MFKVNEQYSKNDIYQILKVPVERQRGAWDTGYREYLGDIYIFANVGVPGRTGHDYDNHWEGSNFIWYGRTSSHINQPLIKKMINREGNVYVFTRIDDKQPFTFQGQGRLKSFEDISPVKIVWTFERLSLINTKEAWQILLRNANELYDSQEIYVSPRQFHKYQIIKVTKDFVRIKRLSVESRTEQDLTYQIFEKAISRINNNQDVLTRRDLYGIVLIEAAIVWLLPMLDWDNDLKHIVVFDNSGNIIKSTKKIDEAKDDLDFQIITRILRIRRGQNKLRENLFYLYQGKCCLTQFHIKELLHACHIIPHSHSGVNATTNAFLFRADIHDLFDSNLIGINPKTLKVATDKVLLNTEYDSLKGMKIVDRIDGNKPDLNALDYRWNIFNSLK